MTVAPPPGSPGVRDVEIRRYVRRAGAPTVAQVLGRFCLPATERDRVAAILEDERGGGE